MREKQETSSNRRFPCKATLFAALSRDVANRVKAGAHRMSIDS
jgi:hypothetical protein